MKEERATEMATGGLDGSVDRIRDYLVEQRVLNGEAGAHDERIYNAGVSCIELSMRPYDRRLLRRSIHDADRVQRIFTEQHGLDSGEANPDPLTPSVHRGLVTLMEHNVHMGAGEGPVPFLFRGGVTLVGASYDIGNGALARQAQRELARIQASLDFMVDLLDWIESGRREGRIETLQQAQEQIDEIEKQAGDRHAHLQQSISRIEQRLTEGLSRPQSLPEPLERSIAETGERLRGLDAIVQGVAGRTAALAGIDGRLDAIQESLGQIDASLRAAGDDDQRRADFERLATDIRREVATLREPSGDDQQLRLMLMAALVLLIALVILVIVLA